MTKTKKSRRDFLKAAGVTGGVAAVAVSYTHLTLPTKRIV